ncbi:MAG: type IX secretion system membrane protein PorP/SprF [Flavobacteriales bacterium]|nr:type IX secretion system membrane protein PorP/SprF [Flavobacteriales bacterium]
MALSRHQWVGFDGAPTTQTFLAHTPLKNESIALGLSAINDRIGPLRQTSAYADFAYPHPHGHRYASGIRLEGVG